MAKAGDSRLHREWLVVYNVQVDADRLKRALRVVRAVRTTSKAVSGHRKLRRFFVDRHAQSHTVLNAAGLFERVRDKEVLPSDVQNAGRAVVNSIPKIYVRVAKHIQNKRRVNK